VDSNLRPSSDCFQWSMCQRLQEISVDGSEFLDLVSIQVFPPSTYFILDSIACHKSSVEWNLVRSPTEAP
jgi:hypothetical protein